MDNEKLKEIRNNLAVLPVLRERAEKLRVMLREAEGNVRELLQKYEKEQMDVEQLKNKTLSATLLRLVGKYEHRLEKEEQEILSAKLEYDKATDRVKELRLELEDIEQRVYTLKQEQRTYEEEIKRREQTIAQGLNNETSEQYRNLEEEREILEHQLVEVNEALRAASRAKSTARSVMQHLDSAESWATYDVWAKGGIFTHMAKYDHLDKAEADFNRLSSQLKDLKKELSDIAMSNVPAMGGIDSTTRAVDFWFDNIFTDLNVRDKIRSDSDQIRSLYGSIDRTITKIEHKKAEVLRKLDYIEQQKNDLILSM